MRRVIRPRPVLVALLVAIALWCCALPAGAECAPGNLLHGRTPVESRGAERVERITDGWSAPEGHPAGSPEAAAFRGLRPLVKWDLGAVVPIVAAVVQADANDRYRLSVSEDGKRYEPLWTLDRAPDPGLRTRYNEDLRANARYVRLEVLGGDAVKAVSEVQLYCQPPEPWPPPRMVERIVIEDPSAIAYGRVYGWKLVLGLCALGFFAWGLPRLRSLRVRRAVWAAIFVASAIAWVQLGRFHGKTVVHYWDAFHYFVGSKYFPELGYFELYRCGALAEREAQHETDVDRLPIRDLEANRVYPGTWSRTDPGRCRAAFSADRWRAFRADLEAFTRIFGDVPLARAFADHGYNATPINTAWLRLWTARASAGETLLVALAQLDTIALVASVVAIFWGFGILPAAVAALMIGLGYPWSYEWVGGGLGRHTWLACTCWGIAFLKREHWFWGAALLTIAGLLRLFPFVLVGGMAVAVFVTSWKNRRLDRASRGVLAGVALAFTVGVSAGALSGGFRAYTEFSRAMERHAKHPFTNQMGLPSLLGFRAGEGTLDLLDERLTDMDQVWKERHLINRAELRPLWWFSIALSIGVLVWSAYRGAPTWQCALLAGPLLFSLQSMTSYDYIWLVCLSALVGGSRRAVWLVGYAAFTVFIGVFLSDMDRQHLFYSLGALVLLVVLTVSVMKEHGGESSPSVLTAGRDT